MKIPALNHTLSDTLKQYFGYDSFRLHQETIINHILDKKDVLAVLPTGSGKSLCYQLPAIEMPGTAIVVSPLIALMQDQVDSLNKLGIHAAYINSSLDPLDMMTIFDDIQSYDLIYVAPERFSNADFMKKLHEINVSFFVVDEAHCISEWGHSFRPQYRQLTYLKQTFPGIPITAFTATATKRVAEDIQNQLLMQDPFVIKSSFDRPNLELRINEKIDPESQLLTFIKKHPDQSGIIYTSTRKKTDRIHQLLTDKKIQAVKYHAGLPITKRQNAQRAFIIDDVKIIVATIAFGMGIHKPDVRFIFHLDMPKNIEQYYQEIGRAGRDGLPAECLMLYSAQDLVLHKKLLSDIQSETIQHELRYKIDQVFALCSSIQCRRVDLLKYFGEQYHSNNCQNCDTCTDNIEQMDGTIIAQKILSCVYRLHQSFGVNHVIDVLTGSKRKDILRRNHDKLSTYALLQDHSKNELKYFIFTLINMGFLALSDGQYPILKLTSSSRQILFKKKPIQFRKRTIHFAKRSKTKELPDHDSELFEQLRKLRKQIADQEQVAPFVVFNDRTLIDMAIYYPQTPGQLLLIHGVGQQKVARYGELFLDCIIEYCKKNGIEAKQDTTPDDILKEIKKEPKKINTRQHSLALIKQGHSLSEVAKLRNISKRTVSTHLAQLVELGEIQDIEFLIEKHRIQPIIDVINKVGDDRLTPIKKQLDDSYTWEEIELIRAYNRALNSNIAAAPKLS